MLPCKSQSRQKSLGNHCTKHVPRLVMSPISLDASHRVWFVVELYYFYFYAVVNEKWSDGHSIQVQTHTNNHCKVFMKWHSFLNFVVLWSDFKQFFSSSYATDGWALNEKSLCMIFRHRLLMEEFLHNWYPIYQPQLIEPGKIQMETTMNITNVSETNRLGLKTHSPFEFSTGGSLFGSNSHDTHCASSEYRLALCIGPDELSKVMSQANRGTTFSKSLFQTNRFSI